MRKSGSLIEFYTKNAIELMLNNENEKGRYQEFANICESVLFSMNAYDNYYFATKVSMRLQKDFKRYFPIDQFENKVLAENDDMLSYLFAENVVGADTKKFIKNIENKELKSKLERLLEVANPTMEA